VVLPQLQGGSARVCKLGCSCYNEEDKRFQNDTEAFMKTGMGVIALAVLLLFTGCAANDEPEEKNQNEKSTTENDSKQPETLIDEQKAPLIAAEIEELSKEVLDQYQDTDIDSLKAKQQKDSTAFSVDVQLTYDGILTQNIVLSHAAELARHLSNFEKEGYVENLNMQWKLADETSYGTNLKLVNENGELRLTDGKFAKGVE
jgi:hypothetical protein